MSGLTGGYKFMNSIKHFLIRVYLYILFFLFFITVGLLPLILMPVYRRAFAIQANYRDLKLRSILPYAYKIIWRHFTNKDYREAFNVVDFTSPPQIDTDTNLVTISETWPGGADNCDACEAACCRVLGCPLLDENNRCQGYGSMFFSYFQCGRFPQNQKQIDFYKCPKWVPVK